MAIDYRRNLLYVVSSSTRQIQVFDCNSFSPITFFPPVGGSFSFKYPWDVAVDGHGSIYVADFQNMEVEKFDSGYGYLGPIGAGVSATGVWVEDMQGGVSQNVYISSLQNYVYQYTGSGTVYTSAATLGGPGVLNSPNALIKVGKWLYVTDTYNDHIVKFDMTTANPSPITVVSVLCPSGIRTDLAGNFYVGESNCNNANGAGYMDLFNPDFSVKNSCLIPDVWGVAANQLGNVFVSHANGNTVTVVQGCGLEPTITPSITPTPTPSHCQGIIEAFVYPNPANGHALNLSYDLCEPGSVQVSIYNVSLGLVATFPFQGLSGRNTTSLDISGFSHGIYYYLLQMISSSGTYKTKPMKFAVIRP